MLTNALTRGSTSPTPDRPALESRRGVQPGPTNDLRWLGLGGDGAAAERNDCGWMGLFTEHLCVNPRHWIA